MKAPGENPSETPVLDKILSHLKVKRPTNTEICWDDRFWQELQPIKVRLCDKAREGTLTIDDIEGELANIPDTKGRELKQRNILETLLYDYRDVFIDITNFDSH